MFIILCIIMYILRTVHKHANIPSVERLIVDI